MIHEHVLLVAEVILLLLNHNVKESEVIQSCLTLCDTMDCSPPGSSVHGIFQARILEWVAIAFSRGYSRSRDQTQVSYIAGRHFTFWATREALNHNKDSLYQTYMDVRVGP